MQEEESTQGFASKIAQTASQIEKQKRTKEKMKVNNEIHRWALGYEYTNDIPNDSDESIDDSYLDELEGLYKTREELEEARAKKKKRLKEQKIQVTNLLESIRRRSLPKSDNYQKRSKFFQDINETQSNEPIIILNNLNNLTVGNLNMITPAKDRNVYLTSSTNQVNPLESSDDERRDDHSNENENNIKKDKKLFKTKNKMSRAIPGIIQQNITLERVFYKDLLKLSRQRYITKQSIEFQAKNFSEMQQRKGLIDSPLKRRLQTATETRTPSIMSIYKEQQTINNQNRNQNFRFKSASAVGIRKPLEITMATSATEKPTNSVGSPVERKTILSAKKKESTQSGESDLKEIDFKNNEQLFLSKKLISRSDNFDGNKFEHVTFDKETKQPNFDKTKIVANLKNTLKRPHTSLVVLKTREGKSQLDFNKVAEKKTFSIEPVKDERFLNLINAMNNMYKSANDLNKEPFKRVDNLIKKNKALYGRNEFENETVRNYKLDAENLRLFENFIAKIW